MSLHDKLTGSQPVWFAEVRHQTSIDGPEFDCHQRAEAEGGPYFNTVRVAWRWCETKLTELMAAGVHFSDLEAICDRGRWTWPLGRRHNKEWMEDEPTCSYSCRPDRKRDELAWVYDGDPEVKPDER